MLRLLSSNAKGCKDCLKPSKPCHDGIHWVALAEYSLDEYPCANVSILFSGFLHRFVLAKLSTSSIRVKYGSVTFVFNVMNVSKGGVVFLLSCVLVFACGNANHFGGWLQQIGEGN